MFEIREWACPKCGVQHESDINTAINIFNEGLRIISVGTAYIGELISLEISGYEFTKSLVS